MTRYEWIIETLFLNEENEYEIEDVNHYDSVVDLLEDVRYHAHSNQKCSFGLVMDKGDGPECWAYIDQLTMELPEYMTDAYGRSITKVPEKFKEALLRANTSHQ